LRWGVIDDHLVFEDLRSIGLGKKRRLDGALLMRPTAISGHISGGMS
jgi:hypothetical protein